MASPRYRPSLGPVASPAQLRAAFLRWSLFLVPLVLLLGFASGMVAASGPQNPWFAALAKPAIYPPPAAFGIVWSVLYAMMGFALAGIVTAQGAPGRGPAIAAFIVQLVLNLAWSPLFFAAHRILWSLVLLGVLDVVVLATVLLFARVRRGAALLLLPYLAWIAFASVLNWQFWVLNPGADGEREAGAAVRVDIGR